MSAPFQPGDVVVCVDDRFRDGPDYVDFRNRVVRGRVYRVEYVAQFYDGAWGVQLVGDGAGPTSAWEADRFRKIDDEVTEDFREQLRSLKSPKPTLNPSRYSRERVG